MGPSPATHAGPSLGGLRQGKGIFTARNSETVILMAMLRNSVPHVGTTNVLTLE